jgi:hypothetical protein
LRILLSGFNSQAIEIALLTGLMEKLILIILDGIAIAKNQAIPPV